MTKHSFDRAIEELARRQHGAFNHGQAVLLGGSDTMISDRVRSGSWIRLARGIYALASYSPTWKRQYKAAELSKPQAAISGRPAGFVHGFEGFRVLRPELVVPEGVSVRSTLAVVRRGSDVPIAVVDRIRVTSVAQTLYDLLGTCPLQVVERAMDDSLLGHTLDLADCEERLEAFKGSRRPHLRTYEALVAERRADGWTPLESELERGLGAILDRLPPGIEVVRQSGLPWWQPGEGRVDFLVVPWCLILEADGRRWHARVADFDRDRWRDNVAQANGHRVLRFTHTHINERPNEVLELVLATGQWRSVAA